jgi:hypothetical protein
MDMGRILAPREVEIVCCSQLQYPCVFHVKKAASDAHHTVLNMRSEILTWLRQGGIMYAALHTALAYGSTGSAFLLFSFLDNSLETHEHVLPIVIEHDMYSLLQQFIYENVALYKSQDGIHRICVLLHIAITLSAAGSVRVLEHALQLAYTHVSDCIVTKVEDTITRLCVVTTRVDTELALQLPPNDDDQTTDAAMLDCT